MVKTTFSWVRQWVTMCQKPVIAARAALPAPLLGEPLARETGLS